MCVCVGRWRCKQIFKEAVSKFLLAQKHGISEPHAQLYTHRNHNSRLGISEPARLSPPLPTCARGAGCECPGQHLFCLAPTRLHPEGGWGGGGALRFSRKLYPSADQDQQTSSTLTACSHFQVGWGGEEACAFRDAILLCQQEQVREQAPTLWVGLELWGILWGRWWLCNQILKEALLARKDGISAPAKFCFGASCQGGGSGGSWSALGYSLFGNLTAPPPPHTYTHKNIPTKLYTRSDHNSRLGSPFPGRVGQGEEPCGFRDAILCASRNR